MKILLLALITVINAGPPDDWVCKPLDEQDDYDEDCIPFKMYEDGVHTIKSSDGDDPRRLCVATLASDDIVESKNSYLKATFNEYTGQTAFFGGLVFNLDDPHHGNYILFRLGSGGVEVGYIDNGQKRALKIYDNDAALSFPLTVEVLNQNGDLTIWLNGVLDVEGSDVAPHYNENGRAGIHIQNLAMAQTALVSDAEMCTPVRCTKDDGTIIEDGDSFMDPDGLKECTCTKDGIICECPAPALTCSSGTEIWTDPETCESQCVPPQGYCRSSGDPHYTTFDKKYYDFHGVCTYLAAICGDFSVNFKNMDIHNGAPRYTERIELEFKADVFMIGAHSLVAVNPDPDNIVTNVALPYYKTYGDGSRVEIINNGQHEIRLYSKGRDPSIRLRSTNSNSYINAEMWLHGSCANITEGLCGIWNNKPGDDLYGGTPNSNGEHYQEYDEDCPEPPPPYNPCTDLIPGYDMSDDAYEICKHLEEPPFDVCNEAVPIGTMDKPGVLQTCMTDVCQCMLDENCACDQYDAYASSCIEEGIDLSNWAESVDYCPMDCPEGMTYDGAGASPPAECGKPAGTGSVRGCFCDPDKVFQDGQCIDASECKCMYEGALFVNGETIKKETECEICVCEDAGSMTCDDMECPPLECEDDEIESTVEGKCCKVCDDSWVIAVNPDNTANKGQTVVLTCEINAEGVYKKDIQWYKDGEPITEGVSKNKKQLTLDDVDGDDTGTYTCEATKDGKTASDDFNVEVIVPPLEQCEYDDGHKWDAGTTYKPNPTTECTCKDDATYDCECVDDGEGCPEDLPIITFDEDCVKTCVAEEINLIDPETKDVTYTPGEALVISVDKDMANKDLIEDVTLECNGEKVEGENVEFKDGKKFYSFTIDPADESYAGTCTVTASGTGVVDDTCEFNVKSEVDELNLIDPGETTDITYTPGGPLVLTVYKDKKNMDKVEDVSLECNGEKVEGDNVTFKDGKKFYSFTIDPADESYAGTCTVTASGTGVADDTVEFNVTAA